MLLELLRSWTRASGAAARPSLWAAVGLMLVGLLSPRQVAAQQRAAAEMLFEEGRQAMDAGDFDTACAKFEESNRLDAASGTTLNLANCEERRGHVASAWERYRAAVRLLADGDRRREFAKNKVRQLEPLVPHLTVELSSEAPSETQVSRNGKALTGSLGVPLPLDPGEYTITAMAPGQLSADYQVTLEEGEQKSITVEPGAVVDEKDDTPQTKVIVQKDSGATARTLGYVFGGIGAASLAGAGVFGYLAYREAQTIRSDCEIIEGAAVSVCRSEAGPDAQPRGKRNALLADVLSIAGGVSLGVGLYFYFTAPDEPQAGVQAGFVNGLPGVRVNGTF